MSFKPLLVLLSLTLSLAHADENAEAWPGASKRNIRRPASSVSTPRRFPPSMKS
jgi:hypothetical protein